MKFCLKHFNGEKLIKVNAIIVSLRETVGKGVVKTEENIVKKKTNKKTTTLDSIC